MLDFFRLHGPCDPSFRTPVVSALPPNFSTPIPVELNRRSVSILVSLVGLISLMAGPGKAPTSTRKYGWFARNSKHPTGSAFASGNLWGSNGSKRLRLGTSAACARRVFIWETFLTNPVHPAPRCGRLDSAVLFCAEGETEDGFLTEE